MKKLLFILLLLPVFAFAQTHKVDCNSYRANAEFYFAQHSYFLAKSKGINITTLEANRYLLQAKEWLDSSTKYISLYEKCGGMTTQQEKVEHYKALYYTLYDSSFYYMDASDTASEIMDLHYTIAYNRCIGSVYYYQDKIRRLTNNPAWYSDSGRFEAIRMKWRGRP